VIGVHDVHRKRQNRAAVSTDSAAANEDPRVKEASERRFSSEEETNPRRKRSCRHSPHGLSPAPAMPISFLFFFSLYPTIAQFPTKDWDKE
jgi:hypothetical protein